MKKFVLIGAIIGLIVTVLGITGFVYAQIQTPPTPEDPFQPYGNGFHNGHGMMGGHQGTHSGDSGAYHSHAGYLHDYMFDALANALGLTPESLQTRHDAGETTWQIAESLGFSAEEFNTQMLDARDEALNQALAEGVMNEEQADWMLYQMDQMHSSGFGPGDHPCHSSSGTQGSTSRGPGWRWDSQPSP